MKKFKIVNLTNHNVVIIDKEGKKHVFEKSGLIARCYTHMTKAEDINGIPCQYKNIKSIKSTLPPKEKGTLYIVSSMILDANPDRDDLISPDRSQHKTIKDKKGKVIATRGFQRIKKE